MSPASQQLCAYLRRMMTTNNSNHARGSQPPRVRSRPQASGNQRAGTSKLPPRPPCLRRARHAFSPGAGRAPMTGQWPTSGAHAASLPLRSFSSAALGAGFNQSWCARDGADFDSSASLLPCTASLRNDRGHDRAAALSIPPLSLA
jgi:hypothetical protein